MTTEERLEETCGGSCVFDKDNCPCFGVAHPDVIAELGEDYDPEDNFYKAED